MRKFFPQDKNYILYGAQFDKQEELLEYMVEASKEYYQLQYNPLGLLDDTILEIQKSHEVDIMMFEEFYRLISGIYRLKHGNNQLEFLFDGMDHYTKYSVEWDRDFKKWIHSLFALEPFLKTVLQLCVFGAEGHSRYLALKRLNNYLSQYFDVKFYRYRGIIPNRDKAA